MNRQILTWSSALALAVAAIAQNSIYAQDRTTSASASEKWAAAIEQLTRDDQTRPPPKHAVLFVGSSSIVRWKTLADDFPGVPVINRGFGGSQLADSTYYADRIILPYQPRTIVLYAGDNDIAAGKSPQTVAADFNQFYARVHNRLPDTRVIYIAIKPSPSRWSLHEKMEEANSLIATACSKHQNCAFVDIWKDMLTPAGRPRPELFLEDQLHMNQAGYAIWRKALAPLLTPSETRLAR